ncbi:hypothetical protein PR048_000159 [Dryococelus australis]|uniref:C2H2-type domain-containing protein n=1 Tax=Dryococelus australis TaxID=614101 RepID=A0ABQ9IDU4_9NEOP|nr:hypothetical protein PR048_000159 [Dryococelus australis]
MFLVFGTSLYTFVSGGQAFEFGFISAHKASKGSLQGYIDAIAGSATMRKKIFVCPNCNKGYSLRTNLLRHFKFECGKEPRFHCPYCPHKSARNDDMQKHIQRRH